ncbi:MAG: helix-turn-helix domain-containing protein [Candidatus Obscuribacterales bacterium]|jgi:biotin operon repressor
MDTIARAAHIVMAEIERASRHDARIGKLAEEFYAVLPGERSELADKLGVSEFTIDRYLKDLRRAGYKINAEWDGRWR